MVLDPSPLFSDPLKRVVAHSGASTGVYLGSPSIQRLPSGRLVVSHDFFGPNSPKDALGRENTAQIVVSDDEGTTWSPITIIPNCFWASLFQHQNGLYLLGCSANLGDIVIRASHDQGETWTDPRDETSGVLFQGGPGLEPPNYHGAPVPVIIHEGRIWRAFEDNRLAQNYQGQFGLWPVGFHTCVISAALEADLLAAESWHMSNKLAYDPTTDPVEFDPEKVGWLEGNLVVTPAKQIWNILRVNSEPISNQAAIVQVAPDGQQITFGPFPGFIQFPGGMSKFTIRFDPVSQHYWSLTNEVTNPSNPWQRNYLVLISSPDLLHWTPRRVLLHETPQVQFPKIEFQIGFQYVDWQIEDEEIIFVSRTAYQGATNFHDANYITFHRIPNFRQYLMI